MFKKKPCKDTNIILKREKNLCTSENCHNRQASNSQLYFKNYKPTMNLHYPEMYIY